MSRQTVRQSGAIKKRRGGKCAIDDERENEATELLGVFAFLLSRTKMERQRRLYLKIMMLFAAELEDIQRGR
eukprot:CAMPEP_0185017616 /NCGR_PEP_ID=MMETSP1103-20130426/549_1 /TAXON_ID=36769 /ORGANISM="Paraphysomonas bandaiensis, Strain Caron Lab Isolate" /LENGTH=71 /DNA_ID=CAMNT_0027547111 /DNA_START=29 /DNA_END=244 /DNA_ORIENTATION=+